MSQSPRPCVGLLKSLSERKPRGSKSDWQKALRGIAEEAVSQIDVVGTPANSAPWFHPGGAKPAPIVDARVAAELIEVPGALGLPGLQKVATTKMAARPEAFDPVTVLIPALDPMRDKNAPAWTQLWESNAEFLLARSSQPPAAPKDWRQQVKIECKCEYCRELEAFALDPLAQTHRFQARQDHRSHLEARIQQQGLELTHVTERRGSPQTLVCTKDRRNYTKRCVEYRKDLQALEILVRQAGETSEPNQEIVRRIHTACTLAVRWKPVPNA